MVINITQQHIDNGVENSCVACMLGQALAPIFDASENIAEWEVLRDDVYIETYNGHPKYIALPPLAQHNALVFDSGHRSDVQPFSFELPIDELLNG